MEKKDIELYLNQINSNIMIGDLIGTGGTGDVYVLNGYDDEAIIKVVDIERLMKQIQKENSFLKEKKLIEIREKIVDHISQEIHFLEEVKNKHHFTMLLDYYRIMKKDTEVILAFFIIEKRYKCLSDYLMDSVITEDTVLTMGIDICLALQELEKLQIIHRDIKPGNIFVHVINNQPHFILGDFGIARYLEEKYQIVTNIGTPHFSAPEILAGIPLCSTNSDIYSLGATLYFILSQGELLNSRSDGINEALIPRDFVKCIKKATTINPQYRYQNASEFRNDLLAVSISIPQIIPFNHYLERCKRYLLEGMDNSLENAAKVALQGIQEYRSKNMQHLADSCLRMLLYIKLLMVGDYTAFQDADIAALKRLAYSNDAISQYIYSVYLIKKGNKNEGVEWLKKSSDNGAEIGNYVYGRALCQGELVPQDVTKGITCLEAAAKNGYIPAIRYLKRLVLRYSETYRPDADIVNRLQINIINYEENRMRYIIPYM